MDFEEELREALRPPEVPAGFAHRVLAKVPEAYPAARQRSLVRRVMLWAAAIVLAAASVTGIEFEHARMERARGEKAKEQVMLALRITSSKLSQAQAHVRQISDNDENSNGE